MLQDYSKLTVAELRKELSQLNLPTNGRKVELVARLGTAHARAQEPKPDDDSKSMVRKVVTDVNTDVNKKPKLSQGHVGSRNIKGSTFDTWSRRKPRNV